MRPSKFLPIIFLGIAFFGLLDIILAFAILKLVNPPALPLGRAGFFVFMLTKD